MLLKKMPPIPVFLPIGSAEIVIGINADKAATTDSSLRIVGTALAHPIVAGTMLSASGSPGNFIPDRPFSLQKAAVSRYRLLPRAFP